MMTKNVLAVASWKQHVEVCLSVYVESVEVYRQP